VLGPAPEDEYDGFTVRLALLFFFILLSAGAGTAAASDPNVARVLIEEAQRTSGQDPKGALRLLDRAFLLLGPQDSALRREALSKKCWWTAYGGGDAAIAVAESGLAEAGRTKNPRLSAELHVCRGYAYEQQDRIDEAAREYEIGVQEGERLGDRNILAQALALRGELRYYQGDFGDALVDLNRAHEIAVALGNQGDQRHALNAIANLYADARVGQYDRALEYYRQLLAANEAAGLTGGISTSHFNLGSTLERKGDLNGALAHYRKSLEIERQRKDLGEAAFVQRSIGVVLTKQDRPREALPWLDEAVSYFERAGEAERLAQARLSRAVALRKLGRLHDALIDLEAARRRFEATGNERFLEKIHDERGLVLAATGDWKGAFAARTAQMALQEKLGEKMREEHTSRLRVQFDTEKKEQDNRALLRENALRGRALQDAERIRSLQRVVILLGAGLVAILGYLAIRHILNARRFRAMAMTDELTRLPNRRHILGIAEGQVRAARQNGATFCLIGLDIDHFKRINDTCGHDVGDRVLQRVAHTCRAALRQGDWMGRTGGEEFLVVLPRTSATTAVEVASRLREAVEAIDCTDLDPSLRVTISLGVTESTSADPGLAAVAKRADESLYRAKQGGRNRVELSAAAA
jgi:diguanylate cyclase (GGDEF)-like protein